MSAAQPVSDFNWPSPEVSECPYPLYKALRERAPIYRVPGTTAYLISRWEDIAHVAQQADLFQQPEFIPELMPHFEVDVPTVQKYTPQPTVTTNGPGHKVKRASGLRLVERERLRSYEPMMQAISNELIDAFIDNGECEFRRAFAEQLSVYVMMDLLGLPRQDAAFFQHEEGGTADEFHKWNEYMLAALLERREHPTDDFLSELLQAQIERDGAVDINYQIAEAVNFAVAGSETTPHVLTNMMLLLCRHPEVMEEVRADRSLLRPVVEESMRLETPVQWLPRITMAGTVVGGIEIPAGATLWLLWGSGNRDPERFEDPEEFRPHRPNLAKQLGFGQGAHLCLGAPLARQEAVIGFDRLLTRLKNIRLVEKRSDLSNINKETPSQIEGVFDVAGTMHAAKTLTITFERA